MQDIQNPQCAHEYKFNVKYTRYQEIHVSFISWSSVSAIRFKAINEQKSATFLLTVFATAWIEERSAPAEIQHVVQLAGDDAIAVSVNRVVVHLYLIRENAVAFAGRDILDDRHAEESCRNNVYVRLRIGRHEYFRNATAGHVRVILSIEYDHLRQTTSTGSIRL